MNKNDVVHQYVKGEITREEYLRARISPIESEETKSSASKGMITTLATVAGVVVSACAGLLMGVDLHDK